MTFLSLILFWVINLVAYGVANAMVWVFFIGALALVFGVIAVIAWLANLIRGR